MTDFKETCYLCGEHDLEGFQSYNWLVKCKKCGLVYSSDLSADPRDVMGHFYDERNLAHRKLIQSVLFRVARRRFSWLMKQISIVKGRLLEIGCGTGEFLAIARNYGWQVDGVELSKSFSVAARDWYQLDLYNNYLSNIKFDNAGFDVVVLLHVFEHLTDPLEFLKQVSPLVNPGGWLFIVVPNLQSWTDRQFGKASPTIIKMDHFFHYDTATLQAMLSRSEFKPQDVITFEPPHHFWTSLYGYLAFLRHSGGHAAASADKRANVKWINSVKSNLPYWMGLIFSPFFVPLRMWLQKTDQGHEIYMLCRK